MHSLYWKWIEDKVIGVAVDDHEFNINKKKHVKKKKKETEMKKIELPSCDFSDFINGKLINISYTHYV